MDSAIIESEEQLLLKTLPDVVWKHVFANLLFDFKTLDSCSQISEYLDDLVKRHEHVSIVGGDASRSFGCVPKSVGLSLFPEPMLPKLQITALNICVSPALEPAKDYLEWLIKSQRDSLEILHVSCLGNKYNRFELKLAGMSKLRVLRVERSVRWEQETDFRPSLTFAERPSLPALESLTLSAFGCDLWSELLSKIIHAVPEYAICETVKHLRFLSADAYHLRFPTLWVTGEFVLPNMLPNLVSLKIPANHSNDISKIYKASENLKRLTLSLPTEGFHKHLYDVTITGYGRQVCAAILANPNRDPQEIRAEIEEENERQLDNFEHRERERIIADNELRREGRRFLNLTDFTDLKELTLKSDTGSWGPTGVSCSDLLSMTSLKTLRFFGFYPKNIPDEMMAKLEERFTVIITPNSDHSMDSSKIKNAPVRQNLLDALPEAVWKQVLCHLISFQTLESCSEASDMFEDLIEKAGLLSIGPTKIVPSNVGNRISFHRGITPIPRLTTLDFCVNSNFQPTEPMAYYLNCLLKSNRDSLEILRISWLNRDDSLKVDLSEMMKLRDLTLVRYREYYHGDIKTLHFRRTAFLPALQTLTLSAFGRHVHWYDFLGFGRDYPACEALKHLRVLPGRPIYVQFLMGQLSKDFLFPHLVSLEIPAVQMDRQLLDLFPVPETLKRLTLTLPTEGLHEHLFDVAITGYGDQVCAAILANPDRDPQEIRAEIEEENERQVRQLGGERGDMEYDWKLRRVEWDNRLRREGRRWPNITGFLGLEELTLKSGTANWGPTGVSCSDLLSMKSLKTLRFSGFYPKYIPDDMMDDLKAVFTVAWG